MKKLLALAFVGMIGTSGICVADSETKNNKIKNAMIEALQEVLKERQRLVFEKKDDKIVVSHYDKNRDFTINLWENKFPIAVGALAFVVATPLFYKFFKSKMFREENSSDVLGDMSALLCTIAASGCSSYILSKIGKALLNVAERVSEDIEKEEKILGEDKPEELEQELEQGLEEELEEDSDPRFDEIEVEIPEQELVEVELDELIEEPAEELVEDYIGE